MARKTSPSLLFLFLSIALFNLGITTFIFHRSLFICGRDDGSATTNALHPPETHQQKESHTLVVVRCKGNLTWLGDVPSSWRIIVYEKCSNEAYTPYSVLTAVRAGSDECNGYLDYLVDYYDNASAVNVFMHDDALWGHSRHRGIRAHTPFDNFRQVVDATRRYLTPGQGFVTYGVLTKEEAFGGDAAHDKAQKALWPLLRTDAHPRPPDSINYKPSAHFAVRREAIRSRPKGTYEALLSLMRYSKDVPNHYLDSRMLCWTMERSWHILFGEAAELPMQSRVFDLMIRDDVITNETFKWNAYDGF